MILYNFLNRFYKFFNKFYNDVKYYNLQLNFIIDNMEQLFKDALNFIKNLPQ